MNLNPFEDEKNEYELEDVLEEVCWESFDIKPEYSNLFDSFDYELLIRSINTKIDWHILDTGGYQGDYWYIAEYNGKIYFIDVGYGSCSFCDAFMAAETSIKELKELQANLKSSIREYDNWEEFITWLVNCNEWWFDEKDEILDFVKKEFNIDFEICRTAKLKKVEDNNE